MAHHDAEALDASEESYHFNPLTMGGSALEYLPDQLGMKDSRKRMCCGAMECFGCAYAMDVCCTIQVMTRIEKGTDKYSMQYLPFYEACWPCMGIAHFGKCAHGDRLRSISKYFKCGLDNTKWLKTYMGPLYDCLAGA